MNISKVNLLLGALFAISALGIYLRLFGVDYSIEEEKDKSGFIVLSNSAFDMETSFILYNKNNKKGYYMAFDDDERCRGKKAIRGVFRSSWKDGDRLICFFPRDLLPGLLRRDSAFPPVLWIPKGTSRANIKLTEVSGSGRYGDYGLTVRMWRYNMSILYWIMICGAYFLFPLLLIFIVLRIYFVYVIMR